MRNAYSILCELTSVDEAQRLLDFISSSHELKNKNLFITKYWGFNDDKEIILLAFPDSDVAVPVVKFTVNIFHRVSKPTNYSLICDCILALRDACYGYEQQERFYYDLTDELRNPEVAVRPDAHLE